MLLKMFSNILMVQSKRKTSVISVCPKSFSFRDKKLQGYFVILGNQMADISAQSKHESTGTLTNDPIFVLNSVAQLPKDYVKNCSYIIFQKEQQVKMHSCSDI